MGFGLTRSQLWNSHSKPLTLHSIHTRSASFQIQSLPDASPFLHGGLAQGPRPWSANVPRSHCLRALSNLIRMPVIKPLVLRSITCSHSSQTDSLMNADVLCDRNIYPPRGELNSSTRSNAFWLVTNRSQTLTV